MDIKSFFKPGREDFTRETTLYFVLALCFIAVALSALAFYLYYVLRGVAEPSQIVEKSLEQRRIESVTAPKNISSVSAEAYEGISASKKGQAPQNVLDSLTVPNKK